MDRAYNRSNPSKVDTKFVYGGKSQKKCVIYKVKCMMCGAIYAEKKTKKIMGSNLSYFQNLLNNRQK